MLALESSKIFIKVLVFSRKYISNGENSEEGKRRVNNPMQTIQTFYGITADLSEEMIVKYSEDLEGFSSLAQKLERYAETDSIYLREFMRKRNYKGIAATIRMLEAHGYNHPVKGFCYVDIADGKLKAFPVSDWIDIYDGMYEVLYISCCNSGKVILPQRKSVLVYPQDTYNGAEIIRECDGTGICSLQIVEGKK